MYPLKTACRRQYKNTQLTVLNGPIHINIFMIISLKKFSFFS
jgi:hypothetical protein